jgi:6-phosphogluconolactonase (cycloisomerase 2 family)
MQPYALAVLAALTVAACENVNAPNDMPPPPVRQDTVGAVYTLTNQAGGNAVLVFTRASDGTLTSAGNTPTGGLGAGDAFVSQGSLILSEDNRWLLAANAGSNDISVFSASPGGLTLIQRIGSNGKLPASVTIRDSLVYVLNAADTGNIAGFRQASDGTLSAIAGSVQPLSAVRAGGAQVSFTPNGRALIVTERLSNVIDVYPVNEAGVASAPHVHASSGTSPIGFAFNQQGAMVVSESFLGAIDAGAASSYFVGPNGELSIATASLGTTESTAGWVVVTEDGRLAYVANAGSSSITGYAIDPFGFLSRLDASGVTGFTGENAFAMDMAFSDDGRFLYVLSGGDRSITAFRTLANGRLEILGATGLLPGGLVGLASR